MKCNSCGGRFGKMSRHQDGDEGKFNGIRVAWTSCSDNLSFERVIGSNCKLRLRILIARNFFNQVLFQTLFCFHRVVNVHVGAISSFKSRKETVNYIVENKIQLEQIFESYFLPYYIRNISKRNQKMQALNRSSQDTSELSISQIYLSLNLRKL